MLKNSKQSTADLEHAQKLRVLLVPDSVHWVTGTIAKSIAKFNPWIEATIASGPVIDAVLSRQPELIENFDLVHFICPFASRDWLPRFREIIPCVTSHHHVSDWDLIKHNLDGDAIVVGSPEWVEDLNRRGADMARVLCVPYGVDAEMFRPPSPEERLKTRRRLKISPEEIVVGFFGKNSSNEHDRKGIDVFLQAAEELHRVKKVVVLIVGPGWKELVAKLKAVGVKCVWMPFIVDRTDLAKMYHALDFYWVTARVEGGPVTLLEAMSSEVCCLTTNVGIAREIVAHAQNALLLPFNDAGAFVSGTLTLSEEPEVRARLGRNGRKTILETMHVGVTATGVAQVYEKALETFNARTLRKPPFEILRMSAPENRQPVRESTVKEVPLSGFPSSLQRQVRTIEGLAWSEHLILYQQQRVLALKMIAREWIRNPFSLLPLRVLLRRFLPVSLVARVVKLKNRRQPESRLLPNH